MRAAVVLLAGALAAQDGPGAGDDLALRIEPARTAVEFGEGFGLVVERAWAGHLRPEEWQDELLAPLVVSLRDLARREDGGRTVETRRYTARLFRLGDVALPARAMRARDRGDGALRVAFAEDLAFTVSSALPADDGGEAELPREPAPPAVRAAGWVLGLGLLGWPLLWWFARARARPVARPGPPAHATALAALRRLREQTPCGFDAAHAEAVAASAVLRDYTARRFGPPAGELTTEALLAHAALAALSAPLGELLDECLRAADRVKFARHTPDDGERARWFDAAERFVAATQAEERPC